MFGIVDTVKAAIVLAIISVIAGGFWYVNDLKDQLATSENNNKILLESVETQKKVIARIQADVTAIQKANRDLRDLTEDQRREIEALIKKFSLDAKGNARDFGFIASEKPGLVEQLVNRASRAVARCFEIASGAPRTPEEINARTSSEINKECPAIANPNYRPGSRP